MAGKVHAEKTTTAIRVLALWSNMRSGGNCRIDWYRERRTSFSTIARISPGSRRGSRWLTHRKLTPAAIPNREFLRVCTRLPRAACSSPLVEIYEHMQTGRIRLQVVAEHLPRTYLFFGGAAALDSSRHAESCSTRFHTCGSSRIVM